MNYELWIMNYELWIMNYELWIVNCEKKPLFPIFFWNSPWHFFPWGVYSSSPAEIQRTLFDIAREGKQRHIIFEGGEIHQQSQQSPSEEHFLPHQAGIPKKSIKNIESFDSIRNMEAKGERHVNLRPSGLRIYHGEFDPGSERTLAARLKHASRAWSVACYRESGGLVSNT